MVRLASIELGSFFFQPFQLHLQAPDLLVQRSFALLDLVLSRVAVAPEQVGTRIEEMTFPLADLIGMNAGVAGYLG